jgi:hypothetical protein
VAHVGAAKPADSNGPCRINIQFDSNASTLHDSDGRRRQDLCAVLCPTRWRHGGSSQRVSGPQGRWGVAAEGHQSGECWLCLGRGRRGAGCHGWGSQAFPLPGQYLFRFKAPFGKTYGESKRRRRDWGAENVLRWPLLAVWLDTTEDDSAVPKFGGGVTAKVVRLSFDGVAPEGRPAAPVVRLAPEAKAAVRTPVAGNGTPVVANGSKSGPTSEPSLSSLFGSESSAPAASAAAEAAPAPAPGAPDDLGALFDSHSAPSVPVKQVNPMGGGGNPRPMLMNPAQRRVGTPVGQQPAKSSSPADFSHLVDM